MSQGMVASLGKQMLAPVVVGVVLAVPVAFYQAGQVRPSKLTGALAQSSSHTNRYRYLGRSSKRGGSKQRGTKPSSRRRSRSSSFVDAKQVHSPPLPSPPLPSLSLSPIHPSRTPMTAAELPAPLDDTRDLQTGRKGAPGYYHGRRSLCFRS